MNKNGVTQQPPSRWGSAAQSYPLGKSDVGAISGGRHSASTGISISTNIQGIGKVSPKSFEADSKNADALFNQGNKFQLAGKLDEAIGCYRRAVSIRPDFVAAHGNLGVALQKKGALDEAIASYSVTLQYRPNLAETHYNLADIFWTQGKLDKAVESYHKALMLKPAADAYNNLATVLEELGRLDEAMANFRQAILLRPDYAKAHYNLGNIMQDLGQLAGAEVCYRKAIAINPDYVEAHNNLSFVLLLSGRFAEGWKEYWWRTCPQTNLGHPGQPLPDSQNSALNSAKLLPPNLQGMRITLLKDQGLGDELFFLRFAKELQTRGAWVAYVADPRIAPFIRRAKWVDYVAAQGELIENSRVELLASDLPLVLGMTTEAEIPPPIPLVVLPEKRQEIALRLAPHRQAMRPIIGITWRGGVDKQPGKKPLFKEIPPEQLATALRGIQATFVIVQRAPQPGEIAAFEAALGQKALDFSALNDDLEGMLALMEQLDDYIGVSNTNMHLRASVGKTARVLVPHLRDFRWMNEGENSPWFPGFTVYRKTLADGWFSALEQLKKSYAATPHTLNLIPAQFSQPQEPTP